MKIGILGTGDVGQTIGAKLVDIGHQVMLGSRSKVHEGASDWARQVGEGASVGTFEDAARFGELMFCCVGGAHALAVIDAAGADNLADKILIDVSNPLDFSHGFPPVLAITGTDSLGERIQAALPRTRVVKTLNTVANSVMVNPGMFGEPTALFVSANDASAKAEVIKHLNDWFGWNGVIDLGDITSARGTEAWLLLWTRLYGALGTGDFNIRLVKKSEAKPET